MSSDAAIVWATARIGPFSLDSNSKQAVSCSLVLGAVHPGDMPATESQAKSATVSGKGEGEVAGEMSRVAEACATRKPISVQVDLQLRLRFSALDHPALSTNTLLRIYAQLDPRCRRIATLLAALAQVHFSASLPSFSSHLAGPRNSGLPRAL